MPPLTEHLVLQLTKGSELSNVRVLNCWGKEIDSVDIVRLMPNLEKVTLSLNNIASLAPLAACTRITELYLRRNRVSSFAEVEHLRGLAGLHTLWLKDNPIAADPNYRRTVLRLLPGLKQLDDTSVDTKEVLEVRAEPAPPLPLAQGKPAEPAQDDAEDAQSDSGSVEELAMDSGPPARQAAGSDGVVPVRPPPIELAPAIAPAAASAAPQSAVQSAAYSMNDDDNADHALTAIFALLNIVARDRARLRVVRDEVDRLIDAARK